jgi:alpha-N-arabinofuranosidase
MMSPAARLARPAVLLAVLVPWLALPLGAAGQESGPTLTVTANRVVGPVKDIFGLVANEHYWRADDPAHPEWHDDYLGRTVERVRELAPITGRPLNIRNFGTKINGEWGRDGHHWEAALRDPELWDTDPDEWLDYTQRVGGQFQYLVNFGSGTAQEAANLVEYVNGTGDHDGNGVDYAALRAQRGHPEPYGVVLWEIGNELYGQWETGHRADREYDYANPRAKTGGDPRWDGRRASDVGNYAARAAEFARAMRKASPIPIKLYVVGNNWDLNYWGGPERSVKTLMELAGNDVDGVVIHYYPQNPYYGETDADLLGRSEIFDSKLVQLRGLLDRYAPQGKRMEIVVSEWNNRDKSNAQTHQLVNGLFVVDTLLMFANRGVDVANYFAISNYWRAPDSGFTLFEGGDVEKPMPTFYALKLLTQHFGTQVVQSRIAGAPVLSAGGGTKGGFRYPALTAAASLSADKQTLYVIVVNKHASQDLTTAVVLDGFAAGATARTVTLTGPSLNADNAGAERVTLREGTISDAGPRFSYTFPARSATALIFTAPAPVQTQPAAADALAPPPVDQDPPWLVIGLGAAGALALLGGGAGLGWWLQARRGRPAPAMRAPAPAFPPAFPDGLVGPRSPADRPPPDRDDGPELYG